MSIKLYTPYTNHASQAELLLLEKKIVDKRTRIQKIVCKLFSIESVSYYGWTIKVSQTYGIVDCIRKGDVMCDNLQNLWVAIDRGENFTIKSAKRLHHVDIRDIKFLSITGNVSI